MFLSDISIKRPVFATMMMVALVVLGIVSYTRLAIDEYPDVTYPVVVVQSSYPGASPEVMEREVSRPIEEALNTIQGLKEVTSTSFEGSSLVRVQLNLGVNVMDAQQDVQAKRANPRQTTATTVTVPATTTVFSIKLFGSPTESPADMAKRLVDLVTTKQVPIGNAPVVSAVITVAGSAGGKTSSASHVGVTAALLCAVVLVTLAV